MMAGSPVRARVLVVDDLEGPREAISMMLRMKYEVWTAHDARSALRFLRRQQVELVVQDLGLPDCDGIRLLRRIKMLHRGVPVIVVSGLGTIQSAEDAMKAGAAAYLLKPFNLEEMLVLIGELVKPPPKPIRPVYISKAAPSNSPERAVHSGAKPA